MEALRNGSSKAHIHNAVEANPAQDIIRLLVEKPFGFDAALRAEIAVCLNQGTKLDAIPFGNPSRLRPTLNSKSILASRFSQRGMVG